MIKTVIIEGRVCTEEGLPLRYGSPSQRKRATMKRQARYPVTPRPKENAYRRAAIATLNEVHQRLDYYRGVIRRFQRIDQEGTYLFDMYLMRDVRKAGSREKLLADLLSRARYTLATASQFGKNAGGSILPA